MEFKVELKNSNTTRRRLLPLTGLKHLRIMRILTKRAHKCLLMDQKPTQESGLALLSMKKVSSWRKDLADFPPYAAKFQAELFAISKTLELCGTKYESFSLNNDSMLSLMALSNPNCHDPLVAEIHELRVGLEVKLYWIKVHMMSIATKLQIRLQK